MQPDCKQVRGDEMIKAGQDLNPKTGLSFQKHFSFHQKMIFLPGC